MQRTHIGKIETSRIAYGLMDLGGSWDVDDRVPESVVRERLDACLSVGITTLDHADIYTAYRGEAVLGQAFRASPGLRDRFEVVTKAGIVASFGQHAGAHGDVPVKHHDTSPAYLRASLERSLRHLHTDRVDLFLLHRPDPLMDHESTGRALDGLVADGLTIAVGVSNFRPWDVELLQSAMTAPLATNQIQLSLAHLDPFANGDLAHCQQSGLRPMAWSPLGGGALLDAGTCVGAALAAMAQTKKCGADQLALAWLLAHPAGIVPVVGTTRVDRIRAAAGAVDVKLSRVEWFQLYEAGLGREVA